MPATTSLNLQALLKTTAARTGLDGSASRVSGLSPSAQAFYVAVQASHRKSALCVVVVPTDEDVDRFSLDTRFFMAALEGASTTALEDAVKPFPSLQIDPYRNIAPHFGVASARAAALHAIASGTARVLVASAAALMPRLSSPDNLEAAAIELKPGMDLDPVALGDLLVDAGFTREDPVDEHGEFCVRGGIVDWFPAGADKPIRVEFVGDSVESIRRYDPSTQRSIATIDQAAVVPLIEKSGSASVFDYLPNDRDLRFIVREEEDVTAHAAKLVEQVQSSFEAAKKENPTAPAPDALLTPWEEIAERLNHATRLEQLAIDAGSDEQDPAYVSARPTLPTPPTPPTYPTHHIACQPAVEFRGRIQEWIAEVRRMRERGESVLFVAASDGRAERTAELLAEYELRGVLIDRPVMNDELLNLPILITVGQLSKGFRLPQAGLQIIAEADVFEEERTKVERRSDRHRSIAKTFLSDLRDLKVDDLVVHVDHGIGQFVGLKQIGVGDAMQEFMELRYAGDDKLFVPVERLDLVQKYSGTAKPQLDKLGGTSWERTKTRVKKAMRDMAEELLKLYAARKAVPGHAFSPDSHWQREFDDAFEWDLTTDQVNAITDIKRDMESSTPMDRLLCGDVGYGKTEVAMRAAFKAVMDGKQVAFLAPTTVLAFQHQKTLTERFAGFPVKIDMVSRFRSKAEQDQIISDLGAGKVDVIVGTHRLLSKDIQFKDLGLLVVDEEQRFGVVHKERIKQMRRKIDVLTLSATPIPRTLNMSLVGIRDMSIIETPPKDRLSIQTNVVKFDSHVIARAVRHEMERGGQVYFVHNRVESIFSIGALIQRLVPEARVVIGHGQMGEAELEKAMLDFISRQFDVLLATTIIENGLDIPNVNTIIINRADRYGLSQLYQLRGRVGRSDRPAYAYLLIPPETALSSIAKKRLAAIREFSDLGSGFRVAALDLEIRGAGNLLGGEQSGHIETVGFEMYMKLLEQAVRELKGEDLVDDVRAIVNLRVDLRVDDSYVPDMNQRLMIYRKVADARSDAELDQVLTELRDRYGPWPEPVDHLEQYGRIRIMADRLGVESIDREAQTVVIKFRPDTDGTRLNVERLLRVIGVRGDTTLVPPATLKLDLRSAAPRPPTPTPHGTKVKARQSSGSSWWTARATAGEVTSGFTKEEILKPPKEDPNASGGVFTKVRGLLAELAGLQ
ncbi:MAG TPA: transcription-repair coupling factor [Vicinamibacterales bacterium]|nr:transcription-repair coupling factor [Vicinamibacterales bacterium]